MELKTSSEWSEFFSDTWLILDPDGWDRKNFKFSWDEELISREEFISRVSNSTVIQHKVPTPED